MKLPASTCGHALGQDRHGTVCGDCYRAHRRIARKSLPVAPLPTHGGHMAPTAGPRDETCALYGDCLTAHTRAHRGRGEVETLASCPAACRWREPVELHAVDYAVATDGRGWAS